MSGTPDFRLPALKLRRQAMSGLLLLPPWILLLLLGDPLVRPLATLSLYGIAFACYWWSFVEDRRRLDAMEILFWGVVLRILLLPMGPSDDLYRCIWEGRMQLLGFDPYALSPSAPELAPYRDGYWELINHKGHAAVYPPLAQALFTGLAALHPGVILFKAAYALFDVAGFFLLRSLLRMPEPLDPSAPLYGPAVRVLALWFLNPLLLLEVSGRGHFDGVPAVLILGFLLVLRHGSWWTPVLFAAAGLMKFTSIALWPMLLRAPLRRGLLWAAAGLAGMLGALWAADALFPLLKFAGGFRFNGMLPWAWDGPGGAALGWRVQARLAGLLFMVGAGVLAYVARKEDPARQGLLLMGWFLVCSPTLHSWYILWILPLAVLRESRPWLLLSGTIMLTIFVYGDFADGGNWHDSGWLRVPQILPPLLLALWPWFRKTRPST